MKMFTALIVLTAVASGQQVRVAAREYNINAVAPYSNLSAAITAMDGTLAGQSATINVNVSAPLSQPITIGVGHKLVLRTPVAINAKLNMSSGSVLDCGGYGIRHTTTLSSDYIVEFGASVGAGAQNCLVTTLSGTPNGGYFAHFSNSSFPRMSRISVTGMGMARADGVTDADIQDVAWDTTFGQGLDLYNADRGRVLRFRGTNTGCVAGGVQVFNHDANNDNPGGLPNWPTAYTRGNMEIAGGYTSGTRFSVFTSVARGMNIHDNEGFAACDTAFDDEGGIDNTWHDNKAPNATGGFGFSVFFETWNVHFYGGSVTRSDGGTLIRVKHTDPGYPYSHANLSFENIALDCGPVICPAFFLENQGSPLSISGNSIHNGAIIPIDRFSGTLYIDRNKMYFDAATTTPYTAIATPGLINGATVSVSDNQIIAFGAPAGSKGIQLNHQDFNAVDFYMATRNQIKGFPTSILYSGDSTNVGAAFYIFDNIVDGTSAAGPLGTPTAGISQGGGNINRGGAARNCNTNGNCI